MIDQNLIESVMTLRAVIYARYSSENQREASIADQVEVCRRYIERQGWRLVDTFDDAALSGASRFRPGLVRLGSEAEAGRFDVVVCEAIDRLGRKLADVADLFDRLTFRRIEVHAVSIGKLTQMHVGIMGTMAQMTLADLRDKTRRGQLGRARAGRIPGGLAYGYAVVTPQVGSREAGERRIEPAEAEVVRRIFRDYAAGRSARYIARDLNAGGVPGPGGRPWIDTTIRGQADRGTGLLNNTLYVGRLSWNRCSYVKDPRTGKRVAQVNDRSQWEEVEIPELRILDQAVWDATKARQATTQFEIGRSGVGNALNRAHRQRFLLSGLLTCGVCGGGYTVIGRDRYGCATRRGKGVCSNGHTITRQRIETRVLDGLKHRLLAPDLVAEFLAAYAEAMAERQREAAGARGRLERELGDVERRLAGIVRAIEGGAWSDVLRARLHDLESRKKDLEASIAVAAKPPAMVTLHPAGIEVYRSKVADLERALGNQDIRDEAATALRTMIDVVVLTPDVESVDRLRVELHGDLATVLSLSRIGDDGSSMTSPRTPAKGSQLSVVAGTGFEPVAFRL